MQVKKALLCGVAAVSILGFSSTIASAAGAGGYDWTGPYIGAHVGYGETTSMKGDWCPSECEFSFSGYDLGGGLAGIQAGYNFQFNSFVVGAEADLSFLGGWNDIAENCEGSCTSSATASVDMIGSVRARLGMAFDRALVYATGGIAIPDYDFEGSCEGPCGKESSGIGPVIGGGAEYAVTDEVSLRAEGLYYFVGGKDSLEGWQEFTAGDNVEFGDIWAIRIGLNWHF